MSKQTGAAFEIEVFKAVQETFGAEQSGWRARHRPAYFSRARNKDIQFDVSVEFRLSPEAEPSILWIWECKDYGSLVPVDDVEEFHSKLEQVGSDRTKGTIITRHGFQESALEYARSKGIGLARLFPSAEVDWILYRATPAELIAMSAGPEEIRRALTRVEYKPTNQDLFALTTGFRTARGLTWDEYVDLQLNEWGLTLT